MVSLQSAFRIGIHLPYRDQNEERAVKNITDYFRWEYNGSTFSNTVKPAYKGFWQSDIGRKFDADLCLLYIDTLVSEQNDGIHYIDAKAKAMVSDIVAKAREFYDMVSRPQESFWVTVTEMKISSAG